jgi:signal transduction histidine kinase
LQNRLKAIPGRPIEIIKNYGNIPEIECYAGQLNQVFMNLLSNAIDALENQPEPRRISIKTEVAIDPPQNLELPNSPTSSAGTNSQPFVAIEIADNGPGISPADLQRLFDPFFTTKPVGKGTGLGLAISYQIVVEKHGGRLKCDSEPGRGAAFTIEIPLTQNTH